LGGCGSRQKTADVQPPRITVEEARAKLRAISAKKVQLWVVVHVREHKHLAADGSVDQEALLAGAVRDVDAALEGGADLVMLINSRCAMPRYESILSAIRARHPDVPLGISALAYGPANLTEGFRLARAFNAQVVWCETVPGERIEYEDDDGTYQPAGVILPDEALGRQRSVMPGAMHVAGVHMKYTRPVDGRSFPDAVRASRGLVDGINVTGPRTAVLADASKVAQAREAAGDWPLGLASGVDVDNIGSVVNYIDYAIVGTSLKDPADDRRVSPARVRALRDRMDELTGEGVGR
jgi:predicted TIM-barrel enzyme